MRQTKDEALMAAWVPVRQPPVMTWELVLKECKVILEPRPSYCDRCKWVAHVICPGFPTNPNPVDSADFFPRPYMHLHVAKSEIVDWALGRDYEPA